MDKAFRVKKKNDELQDWDDNKLLNSLIAAGVPQEEARAILVLLRAYAKRASMGGVIHSSDIKAKIIVMLKITHPAAAIAYESYKSMHPTE
jgi:hypothetical protein